MKGKDCKIVQDLLPNYIEKLTNEETNIFIEEHLNNCEECKEKLKNMQEELNVNNSKSELKQVKYIKKYSNKMKLLKTILSIIVIVYLLFVARNAIIIMNLSIKANNIINVQNYYAKSIAYGGNSILTIEYYKKGDDYYTTWDIFSKHPYEDKMMDIKIIHYKKGDDIVNISEYPDRRELNDITEANKNWMSDYLYRPSSFFENLKLSFFGGIETRECNGKKCYVIKDKEIQRYFDKETGIPVRNISDNIEYNGFGISPVVDFDYKFNVVQDSDIQRPDTTDTPVLNGIQ